MNDRLNNRKIIGIIAIFVLFGCSIVALEFTGSKILSGARGFIYGEGQWTKAQKKAVITLFSYISTQDELQYHLFLDQLNVHEGDRIARETLTSENPDVDAAYEGFLKGGNSPEEIDSMIWLLMNFKSLSSISSAIELLGTG